MKYFFLIILFFSSFTVAHSQPNMQWSKIYNSTAAQDDYFIDMKLDKDGNVYVTGYSRLSTFNYDILTLKYNSSGVLQWTRTFDGRANDYDVSVGIEIDNNGFIYVAGNTMDSVGSSRAFLYLLIKYNSNGDTIWTKKYNNSIDTTDNYNFVQSFTSDKQDNIFITGMGGGHGLDSTPPGYVTIKVDSSGNKLWTRYYKSPAPATDIPNIIVSDKIGNIYVGGNSAAGNAVLIKYSNSGDNLWTASLGTNIGWNRIFFDNTNGVYVGGRRILAKYSLLGNLVWNKFFASSYNSADVQMDSNFNLVTTARLISNGSLFATVKYSSNGDSLWSKTYQPILPSYNDPYSIAIDKYGNIYVTGSTDNHSFSQFFRFLTIKYSPDSTFNWAVHYNNGFEADYQAQKILVDTSGNIYVAGSAKVFNGLDIALVKYSQLTGITQTSSLIPQKFALHQNYPNPFNPTTKINYELPNNSFVQINIYNSIGRQITSLINKKQNSGSYTVNFNSGEYNLSSGIYYYSLLLDGGVVETKKMILLK